MLDTRELVDLYLTSSKNINKVVTKRNSTVTSHTLPECFDYIQFIVMIPMRTELIFLIWSCIGIKGEVRASKIGFSSFRPTKAGPLLKFVLFVCQCFQMCFFLISLSFGVSGGLTS